MDLDQIESEARAAVAEERAKLHALLEREGGSAAQHRSVDRACDATLAHWQVQLEELRGTAT